MGRMAGKQPDSGPTTATVARNVERLRIQQGMNYTELSERLQSKAGWSINAVGIRRIEARERRVTPDDLTALAVALGVSPVSLLMPNTAQKDEDIEVTGLRRQYTAEQVWEWLCATSTGYYPVEHESVEAFFRRAWPQWKQEREHAWLEGIDEVHAGMREKARQLMAMHENTEAQRGDD
ncbi:helix-turn-helix domain-containing protein [Mycolicibacterium smegmatis]|uniref:helix-turn-helix domain-containing protein n=1 Tax=Mycolicibacterium smegmatis TaxID=1772 RepID=UPI001EFA5E95|nr:helix-turn-helix domain-containing protein [Mycolicibacterium smegmatis]ULN34192.1 helix-turn-helix domain-containing protein [Mycolicibacterium smegmatis]